MGLILKGIDYYLITFSQLQTTVFELLINSLKLEYMAMNLINMVRNENF